MRGISSTQLGGDHQVPAGHGVPNALVVDRPAGSDGTLDSAPGCAVARSAWSVWDDAPPDDGYVPDDLVYPTDPELLDGPAVISEQDQFDAELDELLGRNRYSRVDEFEWQEWDGVEQDAAEREMLRR